MPAKSEQQRKMIFAKRGQYKTKAKTPKKWKWVWGKEWEKLEEVSGLNRHITMLEGRDLAKLTRGGALADFGAGGMQQIIDVIKALYDRGMTAEDIAESLLGLLGVQDKKWIDILTDELEQVTQAMSGKDPKKLQKLMAFFNDSYVLISKFIAGNGPKREEVESLMNKYPEFDKHFSDPEGREQYIKLFTTRTMDFGDYKAEKNVMKQSNQRALEAPKVEPLAMPRREKVRVGRKARMNEENNMSHFANYMRKVLQEEPDSILLQNDENTDIDALAKKHLKDAKDPKAALKSFISAAKKIGYSPEDILDGIKNEWKADTIDLMDKYQVELGIHEKGKKDE